MVQVEEVALETNSRTMPSRGARQTSSSEGIMTMILMGLLMLED